MSAWGCLRCRLDPAANLKTAAHAEAVVSAAAEELQALRPVHAEWQALASGAKQRLQQLEPTVAALQQQVAELEGPVAQGGRRAPGERGCRCVWQGPGRVAQWTEDEVLGAACPSCPSWSLLWSPPRLPAGLHARLDGACSAAEEGMAAVAGVRSALADWWSLPALKAAPWIKRELLPARLAISLVPMCLLSSWGSQCSALLPALFVGSQTSGEPVLTQAGCRPGLQASMLLIKTLLCGRRLCR